MQLKRKPLQLLAFGYTALLVLWFSVNFVNLAWEATKGELSFFRLNTLCHVSDFVDFYEAGKVVTSSQREKIYDPTLRAEWISRLIGPHSEQSKFYLQYPPYFFLLMVPFSLLPLNLAHLVWDTMTMGTAWITLYLLLKQTRQWTTKDIAWFLIGVSASLPSVLTLNTGQTTWLLLSLVSLFCWAFCSGKEIVSGFALALTAIKPQYTLWLLVPVLAGKRYKIIGSFLLSEVFLLTLSGLTIGWHNIWDYPRIVYEAQTKTPLASQIMVSLRGLLTCLVGTQLSIAVLGILMLLCLVFLFLLWQRACSHGQEAIGWAMATTIVLSLVVSPHTHLYDCLLLALPAALTIPSVRLNKIARLSDKPLRVWSYAIWLYPLVSWSIFLLLSFSLIAKSLAFLILDSVLAIIAIHITLRAIRQSPGKDW